MFAVLSQTNVETVYCVRVERATCAMRRMCCRLENLIRVNANSKVQRPNLDHRKEGSIKKILKNEKKKPYKNIK